MKRNLTLKIILILSINILIGAGIFLVTKRNVCQKDNLVAQNFNLKNVDYLEKINFTVRPFGGKNLKFSLEIPRIWRATRETRDNLNDSTFGAFNNNLTIIKLLSPYDLKNELMPVDQIAVNDITEWLNVNSSEIAGYPQEVTISEKKQFINFMQDLRQRKQNSDFSQCKSIFIYNCRGVQKEYLESADGIFSGYATIQTSPQAAQYDPTAFIYMIGKIDGKTIYITGRFILYDKILTDSLLKDPSKEEINRYHKILDALKTLTVTIAG